MYTFNDPSTKKFRKRLRNFPTSSEKLLWKFLKVSQLGVKFRRQYSINKYVLDFYCPEKRLCVEVDGIVHDMKHVQLKDKIRDEFIRSKNINIIRVSNNEVLDDVDSVLVKIRKYLDIPPPAPS